MDEFYSLKKEDVLKKLKSSESGLKSSEIEKRQREFGENLIKEKNTRTFFNIFLSQFKSPLILILLFATILAFLLKELIDAFIILAIIFISSLLGFYQEYKSEKALLKLKEYIFFKTKVLRDGKETEIDVRELVPGDIVLLNLGDIVPADLRIIKSQELSANESILTGESNPVMKKDSVINKGPIRINEQSNILFMGSEILNGSGRGIVIRTGENTELGKIAKILSLKEPPSDFQKGINNFGKFLIKIIFIMTVFVFCVNFFFEKGLFNSFLFAIALAVGVTPELLPTIITISLSRGAIRMAEKKVVVKKLVSIEDLGNMDVLCTDKTGTLTENQISLVDYFDLNYKKNDRIVEYSCICNSALTTKHKIIGNQIDKSILDYSHKHKIKIPEHIRIEDIEFDHVRKRMSSIAEIKNQRLLLCKGEVLSVLDVCSKVELNNHVEVIKKYREKIKEKYENLSKKGLKLIAVAYKRVDKKTDYTIKDEINLTFLGFLIFLDPPKKDVRETLRKFSKLGVEVKIITGDNRFVTEEICKKVGFKIKGDIVDGEELEKLNEKEFLRTIEENNVFVRTVPEQKLRIIEGLKKNNHVTGFLGDGVNDAPAIKNSDVGISVNNAADITKNSADIVILKKSLRIIAEGIFEGRKTFENSTKYILNTISANFGNMISLSIASLYFKFIPLLPKQVLLINFISDTPLLTISSDNVDEDNIRKPKRWNIKLIGNFMIFFGIISSIFDLITMALVWFFIAPFNPTVFRTIWFTESVLSEIFVTFIIRTRKPFWKSKPGKLLVLTSVLGVLLTLASLVFLREWFDFAELNFITFCIIGLILVFYLILAEIGKQKFYFKEEEILKH